MDIVFIALDFEGEFSKEARFRIHEAGFSTLDTRDLASLQLESIHTEHFCTGGQRRLARGAKKYIHGDSRHIEQDGIANLLRRLFRTGKYIEAVECIFTVLAGTASY
jgi:hypothetical protein